MATGREIKNTYTPIYGQFLNYVRCFPVADSPSSGIGANSAITSVIPVSSSTRMFFDYFGYSTPSTDSIADLASTSSTTNSVSATNGATISLTPSSGHIDVVPSEHLEGTVTPVVHTNRNTATSSNSDMSNGQSTNASNNDRSTTSNKNISALSTSNGIFINSLHHGASTSYNHNGMHSESHPGNSMMSSLSPQRVNLNSGFGTTVAAIYPSMHQHTSMTVSDTY
ncbi:hypothetical protein DOY81_011945, partial [Sarcophaga bullata]